MFYVKEKLNDSMEVSIEITDEGKTGGQVHCRIYEMITKLI